MKKIIVVLFFILASFLTFGQEETLISGKVQSGGFGAPVVKFSTVKNNFAIFVGGYGGWLINHTLLIGAGGYGLVNKIKGPQSALYFYNYVSDVRIEFGYGGLILEYIGLPNNLIHYSVSVLVGGGEVSYAPINWDIFYDDNYDSKENSTVFVFEPGVNAELNITSFFRINAGVSYRLVSGADLVGLKNNDLSGPAANLVFKFGSF